MDTKKAADGHIGQQHKARIPADLHAWLKETAAKNERSINYLIVKAIKEFKKQQEI